MLEDGLNVNIHFRSALLDTDVPSMSYRFPQAARPRSNISPDEQQQKLASRRRVVNGGGGVTPPMHAQRRHQAHGGQRVTRGDRPAPACYGGRRDGWNEPEYAMPRGSNFQHGGGVGGGGGQFFVNGYPAGVYDPPPQGPRTATMPSMVTVRPWRKRTSRSSSTTSGTTKLTVVLVA